MNSWKLCVKRPHARNKRLAKRKIVVKMCTSESGKDQPSLGVQFRQAWICTDSVDMLWKASLPMEES